MSKPPAPKQPQPGLVASNITRVRNWYYVADRWERIFILTSPLVTGFLACGRLMGVPLFLEGFLGLFAALYQLSVFPFLLILDRRFDAEEYRNFLSRRTQRLELKEAREAKEAAKEAAKEEAVQLRQTRAQQQQQQGPKKPPATGQGPARNPMRSGNPDPVD